MNGFESHARRAGAGRLSRRRRGRNCRCPSAKPEEVGLSSAQLKRIEEATARNIDEGIIPGAVMLVARRGKVAWVSVQGKREPGSADPMKLDSIFRIYSMTKPMVSLALMQMVEEGRLQVTDPVSKFLPEIGT
jgi:CubicO group peptidase (beta-lactamase class C family)